MKIDSVVALIRDERQLLANRMMQSHYPWGPRNDCVPPEAHEAAQTYTEPWSNLSRGFDIAAELFWDDAYELRVIPTGAGDYDTENWTAVLVDPTSKYRSGIGKDRSLAVAIAFSALAAFELEATDFRAAQEAGFAFLDTEYGRVVFEARPMMRLQ